MSPKSLRWSNTRSKMIVLGLDTTGKACACALVDEGRILAHKSEPIGRGHAERLAPMVHGVLAEAGLSISAIDQIAVCTGPGSFTGLRVALAFAKGLALPRKIPVAGISGLEVHAARHDPARNKRIIAYADVRRGELCYQMFENGLPLTPAITDTAEEARAFMAAQNAQICELTAPISAPILAWLSIYTTPDTHPADAFYSRPPDAKLPGGIDPNKP